MASRETVAGKNDGSASNYTRSVWMALSNEMAIQSVCSCDHANELIALGA